MSSRRSNPLPPSDRILNADVVLMCGVSGAGKTHFSTNLEKYGFRRISADEILWDKYGDNFSEIPFPEKKDIFTALGSCIAALVEQSLDAGEKVVVDSTMCKRFKRDAMREVCDRHDVKPLFVYLKAPIELLRQRLSTRKGTGPNDQIIREEQLESFFSNFEIPSEGDDITVIEQ